MNDMYDANMSLKIQDLNNIEDNIESMTNEIQEKLFDNIQSPLHTIEIGDNLDGKTLYLSLPRTAWEFLPNTGSITLFKTNTNSSLKFYNYDDGYMYYLDIYYKNTETNKGSYHTPYYKIDEFYLKNPMQNLVRVKLPSDFGYVTEIDDDNEIYQYIKIYDNEMIMPNYEKHIWQNDEILTMQKIDKLEKSIENIGKYYYRPYGWLKSREWLVTTDLKDVTSSYFDDEHKRSVNFQNISYQDLNRWVNNLSLINFDDLDTMTIWNSVVSEIDWNKQNDTEWEDL